MRFLTLTKYFEHYSQVSKTPRFFHVFFLAPSLIRRRFQNFPSLVRFIRSNQLESCLLSRRDSELPPIEALIVCAPKDFFLISMCIDALVEHSMNRILMVSVVVPDGTEKLCEQHITKSKNRELVRVVPESLFIDADSLVLLKSKFPEGHGWVLQQFLTIKFCSQSNLAGVLAINADTLLLRKQIWLNAKGEQLLMVSSEYHKPYYELLNRLNPRLNDHSRTFITHHMLFQPILLNQFFDEVGCHNASELLERILDLADYSVVSPICMEFEFYAQHMMLLHPNRVQLRKFSNIGVSPNTGIPAEALLERYRNNARYNSISMHSWMN